MAQPSTPSERDRLVAQQKAIVERLREIEREETYRGRLKPDQILAEDLHAALCRSNHSDGCPWLYERPGTEGAEWTREAHRRWLQRARQLVEAVGMEKALTLVPLLKDMR